MLYVPSIHVWTHKADTSIKVTAIAVVSIAKEQETIRLYTLIKALRLFNSTIK